MRGEIAHLVAIAAAIGLDEVEPLLLRLEVLGDAVALVAGAREAAFVRDLQHRIPVIGGVVLRGGSEVRRHLGLQVEELAGLRIDLGRVDQAVAAHPDPVLRLWQVGDHIAAALVGDGDLGKAGAEVAGLGDNPNAGFRAQAAGHDAADIVAIDLDRGGGRGLRLGGRLLRTRPDRDRRDQRGDRKGGYAGPCRAGAHAVLPFDVCAMPFGQARLANPTTKAGSAKGWFRQSTYSAEGSSRCVSPPFAAISRTASRSKLVNTAPPSRRPSKPITPSAKSPPCSKNARPASTAGRSTRTVGDAIRLRREAATSSAPRRYARVVTHTNSQSAGRVRTTVSALFSNCIARAACCGSSRIAARTRTFVSAAILTAPLPNRPQ